jgi:hypothetical protein
MKTAVLGLWLVAALSAAALAGDAGDPRIRDEIGDPHAWSSWRDPQRLRREYSDYRVTPLSTEQFGKGLRWEFKIRAAGQHFSDLFSEFQIGEPFERISIWVRNPERKKIKFFLKLVDCNDHDYAPQPLGVPLGNTADWQRIEFAYGQFRSAPWAHGKKGPLDPPVKSLVLVVVDVDPGEAYRLEFARLEMDRPQKQAFQVVEAIAPRVVDAGSDLAVRLSLKAEQPVRDDYPMVVSLLHVSAGGKRQLWRKWQIDPSVPTSRWKPGEPAALPPVAIHVPRFAAGGATSCTAAWVGPSSACRPVRHWCSTRCDPARAVRFPRRRSGRTTACPRC